PGGAAGKRRCDEGSLRRPASYKNWDSGEGTTVADCRDFRRVADLVEIGRTQRSVAETASVVRGALPSPLPGMDPDLEASGAWEDFQESGMGSGAVQSFEVVVRLV